MNVDRFEHFHVHGWMRLPAAFSPAAACAMREATWNALAAQGVFRDHRATWTLERPTGLQTLKRHPAFAQAASSEVLAAVDGLLDGAVYDPPKTWGAPFIAFPRGGVWSLPSQGWHVDAKYDSALAPLRGVKILALFGDVAPEAGGTLILGGSHRLIHRWFEQSPPPPTARSADMRRLLLEQPYLRDLQTPGDRAARITRFMDAAEVWDGAPLQVVECVGAAGDVYLLHPLTLHAAAPNRGDAPRFLLSGGVTTDAWGWG